MQVSAIKWNKPGYRYDIRCRVDNIETNRYYSMSEGELCASKLRERRPLLFLDPGEYKYAIQSSDSSKRIADAMAVLVATRARDLMMLEEALLRGGDPYVGTFDISQKETDVIMRQCDGIPKEKMLSLLFRRYPSVKYPLREGRHK
jgi:hypothetical protein